MTALHNIALGFSGSNTPPFKVEDFIPNWMGSVEKETAMPAENIKQFFLAFAEQHNKDVKVEQPPKKRKR